MPVSVPAAVLRMRSSVRLGWRHAQPAQRSAVLVGAALVAVGLVHGVLWLVLGGSAQGPLSWRKPTTFGISFGVTTITLAWVSPYLALPRRWVSGSVLAVAAANTYEVAWVSLQHARGVASHFNDSTALDGALFLVAGVAIGVTFAVIALYTVCSFTRLRQTASASLALGLRVGLIVLLVSMAAGAWMIVRGMAFQLEPTQVAGEGSIKSLHAVGMHGVQVVGILGWVLSSVAMAEVARLRLVAAAAVGYVLLTVTVGVLTLAGAPPLGGGALGWVALLLALGLVVAPWSVTLVAVLRDEGPQPFASGPVGRTAETAHPG